MAVTLQVATAAQRRRGCIHGSCGRTGAEGLRIVLEVLLLASTVGPQQQSSADEHPLACRLLIPFRAGEQNRSGRLD